MKRILDFLRREDGPTAVEYAVMLAMIIVVCVGAVQAMGVSTMNSLTTTNAAITTAISGS